jgi:hypothetical protein
MTTTRLQKLMLSLAILLLPIIAFWQVSLMQYTMKWDMMDQLFPWRLFMSECFQEHILPLWCPYAKLGYPFYADPQSGFFYPLAWIFTYFFDYTIYACNAEFITHILLAFLGMYLLLKVQKFSKNTAVIFGLIYALSGMFVSNSQHAPLIGSLTWLPFVLCYYFKTYESRKWIDAVKTGFFLYLLLTGGYIGVVLILGYSLIGYFLWGTYKIVLQKNNSNLVRWLLLNAVLTCSFLAFSAGYIYSVASSLPYISRANGVSLFASGNNAFTPQSLLSLFFPMTTASGSTFFDTDISMSNLYLGIFAPPFLFIALLKNKNVRILFGISLLFLLASFGNYTPFRGWLYSFIPLLNLFQHASIFRFFVGILWLLIAAEGFEITFTSIQISAFDLFKKILPALAFVILILVGVIYFKHPFLFLFQFEKWEQLYAPENLKQLLVLQSGVQIMLLLVATFVLLIPKISLSKKRNLFTVVMLLDMFLAVQGNTFSTVASERNATNFQEAINRLPKGFPIPNNKPTNSFSEWGDATLAPPMWQNAGFVRKEITPDGFNGFKLKNYEALIQDSMIAPQILARPFLISTNVSDSILKNSTKITAFNPKKIVVASEENIATKIKLMQMDFPGWRLTIDGVAFAFSTSSSNNLLVADMKAGKHTAIFEFHPFLVKELFTFTVVMVLFFCGLLGVDFFRKLNFLKQS